MSSASSVTRAVAAAALLTAISFALITCSDKPEQPIEEVGEAEDDLWTPRWLNLPAAAMPWQPTICSWAPNRLDLFYTDTSNDILHYYKPNASSAWKFDTPFRVTGASSSPTCISWSSGRIDLFWNGSGAQQGHLMHKWFQSGYGWSINEDLHDLHLGHIATMVGAPAAASRSQGRLDVFWRGPDNRLKHTYYPWGGTSGAL